MTAYVYDMSTEDPLAHDDITLEFSGEILTRRWMHSNAVDEPVGFEEYVNTSGVGSGTERTMFADRQGSVIWVSSPATGAVVAAYDYDGYGLLTRTVGSLVQPYGYTGREYDPESGLYHYRARAYDPAAGVFLQSDPAGFVAGQFGLYAYAGGNPANWVDPEGLYVQKPTKRGEYAAILAANEAIRLATIPKITSSTIGLANRIALALASVSLYGDSKKDTPSKKDECAELARAKDRAEESMFNGMSCLGLDGLTRAQLESRLYIWLQILEARKASYECWGDGDPNHRDQIETAQRQVRECARRLGL